MLHWLEYLLEGLELGLFMLSASLVVIALEHPGSQLHRSIPNAFFRRALIGVAMGLTAIALIYSPFGRRSGAHMNPAVTLTFFYLGKVAPLDALFYVLFQFAGGAAGMLLARRLAPMLLGHPSVHFVATQPGERGRAVAWFAELVIAFLLMSVVLQTSNRPELAPFTGLFAGALVALFITFEAPFSGMSMNPARTTASALSGRVWKGWWVYLTAPPLAMFLAAAAYRQLDRPVHCAKLCHLGEEPCVFECDYRAESALGSETLGGPAASHPLESHTRP